MKLGPSGTECKVIAEERIQDTGVQEFRKRMQNTEYRIQESECFAELPKPIRHPAPATDY
jgi:hypothetical protein